MSKKEFLAKLKKRLRGLPSEEVESQLNFYSEMIDDKIEDGINEYSAVREISKVIFKDNGDFDDAFNKQDKQKRKPSAVEITLLILGSPIWLSLIVVAVALFLSLYITFIAVLISLWAVFISLACSSVGSIIFGIFVTFTTNTLTGIALIGAAFVCAGLTVIFYLLCKHLTKCTPMFTKTAFRAFFKLFSKRGV